MKQVLMVVSLLCVLPVESEARALLRCDTSPDGGIKVRNFSVAPSAVGVARVGDDCLAAVMTLLGTDPSDIDVSFEVRSVGTEVSFIVLLVPGDDEEDNDGDNGGDNGDNGGGDNGGEG